MFDIIFVTIYLRLEDLPMFDLYQLNETEKKIEQTYFENEILSPSDLTIDKVAKAFNVLVSYAIEEGPQNAIWNDEMSVIFLRSNQPTTKKREIFFHELAHPILHVGDQSLMNNDSFREYQEIQANQFQMYAAIPFFMVKRLSLPDYEPDAISLIQKVFKVGHHLAKKRFDQIKNKIIQVQMDQLLIAESFLTYCPSPLVEDFFTEEDMEEFKFNKVRKPNKPIVYVNSLQCVLYTLDLCNFKWGKQTAYFPIDTDIDVQDIYSFMPDVNTFNVPPEYIFLDPLKPNDFAIDLKKVREHLLFTDIDPYNIDRLVIDAPMLEQLLDLSLVQNLTNKKKTNAV